MKTCVACCCVARMSCWLRIGEVVVAARADLVLAPEHALEIDHALFDRHAVLHLDRHRPEPLAAEHAVLRRLQRDEDLLVGILKAARRALGAQHADDLERNAPDQDRLVDHGGRIAAEHLRHRGAEDRVPLPGGVVAGGEHPAERHRVVADVGIVGGGSDDLQVAVLIAEDDLQRLLGLGHHRLEQRGVAASAS